ncbi:flagellar basal-body MS-ring/collar protein FliF [Shouchella miscanthi]|uniref:flagellar basal-body MS-ring/collar protein FliF n=1 Tax=Shouchella miscanthi TaxID=2598861 RepID=UPI000761AEEA|nr:flagellar basal-body MS-ring/collar protein FliF [Shouchella miscanthi]
MNEKVTNIANKAKLQWNERTKIQKVLLVASVFVLMLLIAALIALSFRTNYAPLYSNLSLAEAGQIQEVLESRGVTTEVANDGTTILVPEREVDRLKVDLAAEGLPQSGSIDYSFFQEQMGFGMTDNEFTVIERSLMQTELAGLISSISGVQNANVVITLAEDSVWLNSGQESATAAVVLDLAPGTTLDQTQVKALYHLIARSVPNLPVENIVLSDSNFMSYTYQEEDSSYAAGSFESQREIKQQIEADLEQTIMQLLHAVVGPNNAIVSVTTDIDFTQEQRTEDLVEPINEEDMEGLAVSAERITEFYEGTGAGEGGVAGTGDEIPNYTGTVAGGDSESERTEERINYEFNRIHKEIIESPYRIRDVSIQAMVNPPEGMMQLPAQQMDNLSAMLNTIVETTIPATVEEAPAATNRVSISSVPFAESAQIENEQPAQGIPMWMIIAAVALLLFIVLLIVLLIRTRKQADTIAIEDQSTHLDIEEDEPIRFTEKEEKEEKKQLKELNQLANQNPEEFSKLLRTWLSED